MICKPHLNNKFFYRHGVILHVYSEPMRLIKAQVSHITALSAQGVNTAICCGRRVVTAAVDAYLSNLKVHPSTVIALTAVAVAVPVLWIAKKRQDDDEVLMIAKFDAWYERSKKKQKIDDALSCDEEVKEITGEIQDPNKIIKVTFYKVNTQTTAPVVKVKFADQHYIDNLVLEDDQQEQLIVSTVVAKENQLAQLGAAMQNKNGVYFNTIVNEDKGHYLIHALKPRVD